MRVDATGEEEAGATRWAESSGEGLVIQWSGEVCCLDFAKWKARSARTTLGDPCLAPD